MPSRGTGRFSDEVVFGELGVLRLRRVHVGAAAVSLTMKPVGKPDAGNPHVRFDERGGETERLDALEADTAPFLDSTEGLAAAQ